MLLDVIVEGRPAPQGSKSYRGNGRFSEASKYLPAWRKAVREAVADAWQGKPLIDYPVRVVIRFYLAKPKNPKFPWPATPPDVDKLIRGVFDSLTGVCVVDDALFVQVEASKQWASGEPGAWVFVDNI